MSPVCPPPKKNKAGSFYCDSHCETKELNEPMVDIVANDEEEILNTFTFQWKFFRQESCALEEKCISSPGNCFLLLLLLFSRLYYSHCSKRMQFVASF